MRQSLSKRPVGEDTRGGRTPRSAAIWIWAAAAASLVVLVVAFVDQAGGQRLYAFTEAAYAAHGVTPDPGLVYAILYTVATVITLTWGLMLALSKTRGWWPVIHSTAATVITAIAAILLLTAAEYGQQVFSPTWGLLLLAPTALGFAATIRLVRDARN